MSKAAAATGMTQTRRENLAKLACAYAGLIWGVFWIPLRALDAAGVNGAWATAFYYVAPLVIVAPIFLFRFRQLLAGGLRLHVTGLLAALSLVLYADAMLYTEVIRGMLLYYMTPVWSTLLARIWLGEKITGIRMLAIGLGLFGMLTIFGIDSGIPWPRNVGDWMGLASGIVWAVAAVRMRYEEDTDAIEYSLVYFLWGAAAAIVIALLPISGGYPVPSLAVMLDTAIWSIPFIVILVITAVYAVMWGTPHLSPGIVGLLFMTEISVGTITAAIWAGEPFGLREIIGVLAITTAGLAEVVVVPLGRLRFRRHSR